MTRRPSSRRASLFAFAAVLLLACRALGGDLVTFDVPGASLTVGLGIDNQAVVTGGYYDAGGNAHGLVYDDGVFSTVDGPTSNPPSSQAFLNNLNQQHWAGAQYIGDDGIFRAALYNIKTQTWNTLPVIPGTGYNAAGGVNAQGVAAGNWTTDPTVATGNQGWTFDPKIGSYSFFDVPGADKVNYIGTIVNAINNAGVVVGYYTDKNGVPHGFTKSGDRYRTIDVGSDYTAIQGINNKGDVSGVYQTAGVRHGFVLSSNGDLTTIDVPGVNNTALFGVSENGNVAGYYVTADGVFHGFYERHGAD
jgi:probable HAF family extracellular repeat protein